MQTIDKSRSDAPQRRMSDTEILELAAELVETFMVMIEQDDLGHDILDARHLPQTREALERAFRLAIMTEPRQEIRRKLIEAGSRLAQFQDGVGQRVVVAPVHRQVETLDVDKRNPNRLDLLLDIVETDTDRLQRSLAAADHNASRRYSNATTARTTPEDGTYTWYDHHALH